MRSKPSLRSLSDHCPGKRARSSGPARELCACLAPRACLLPSLENRLENEIYKEPRSARGFSVFIFHGRKRNKICMYISEDFDGGRENGGA